MARKKKKHPKGGVHRKEDRHPKEDGHSKEDEHPRNEHGHSNGQGGYSSWLGELIKHVQSGIQNFIINVARVIYAKLKTVAIYLSYHFQFDDVDSTISPENRNENHSSAVIATPPSWVAFVPLSSEGLEIVKAAVERGDAVPDAATHPHWPNTHDLTTLDGARKLLEFFMDISLEHWEHDVGTHVYEQLQEAIKIAPIITWNEFEALELDDKAYVQIETRGLTVNFVCDKDEVTANMDLFDLSIHEKLKKVGVNLCRPRQTCTATPKKETSSTSGVRSLSSPTNVIDLALENDVSIVPSWSCAVCTFLHEGSLANATHCDACGTSRGEELPRSSVSENEKATQAAPVSSTTTQEGSLCSVQEAPTSQPSIQESSSKVKHENRQSSETSSCDDDSNQSPRSYAAAVLAKVGKDPLTTPVSSTTATQADSSCSVQKATMSETLIHESSSKVKDKSRHSSNRCVTGSGVDDFKSSVAAETIEQVIRVEPTLVGLIIGKRGVRANNMQKKSGAKIWIDKKTGPDEKQGVCITGNKEQVDAGVRLVKQALGKSKGREQESAPTESSSVAGNPDGMLLSFLVEQKACLKGSPEAFSCWLADTQGIVNLDSLAKALSRENYLRGVLQPGDGKVGVKGYKRNAFKAAVIAAASGAKDGIATEAVSAKGNVDPPTELICPISHVLMTDDPVIAADGHTYERAAITAWFEKQTEEAKGQLALDSGSQKERAFVERGVLSPMTNEQLPHLDLTPNHCARTMARDFQASTAS